MQLMPHHERPHSRRDFLARAGGGLGMLALADLLRQDGYAAEPSAPPNPLAARQPHFPARAKSVIWVFLDGGPSHIDLFDPKPELTKLNGKPLPDSFERPVTAMGKTAFTPLLGSKRKFQQHGQSGLWVSDWYPEIATCADDLAVIRSCRAEGLTHAASICQMNTGSLLPGRPCLGAWALYGLGSVSENLPGFVVLTDSSREPPGAGMHWGAGFMPAAFQGNRFTTGKNPIPYVEPAAGQSEARQQAKLRYIQELNRLQAERSASD